MVRVERAHPKGWVTGAEEHRRIERSRDASLLGSPVRVSTTLDTLLEKESITQDWSPAFAGVTFQRGVRRIRLTLRSDPGEIRPFDKLRVKSL